IRRLVHAVSAMRDGGAEPDEVFRAAQSEFAQLPFAAFGYWCSSSVREAFIAHPILEGPVTQVRVGLQTSDDFRFLRLRCEISPDSIGEGRPWLPFAKGGEYSPYHDDIHLI